MLVRHAHTFNVVEMFISSKRFRFVPKVRILGTVVRHSFTDEVQHCMAVHLFRRAMKVMVGDVEAYFDKNRAMGTVLNGLVESSIGE